MYLPPRSGCLRPGPLSTGQLSRPASNPCTRRSAARQHRGRPGSRPRRARAARASDRAPGSGRRTRRYRSPAPPTRRRGAVAPRPPGRGARSRPRGAGGCASPAGVRTLRNRPESRPGSPPRVRTRPRPYPDRGFSAVCWLSGARPCATPRARAPRASQPIRARTPVPQARLRGSPIRPRSPQAPPRAPYAGYRARQGGPRSRLAGRSIS